MTILTLLYKINFRFFFGKISENLSFLLLLSQPKSSEIPNINKKKFKIRFFTCNILVLSRPNLTYSILLLKMCCVDIFIKVLDYLFYYKLTKKAEIWTVETR